MAERMQLSKVSALVLQLDFEWFKKKVAFFQAEGLYNEKLDKVYDIIEDYQFWEDDEGVLELQQKDLVIDVDFNSYCWSCVFYGSDGQRRFTNQTNEPGNEFPIDSREVADGIIRLIYCFTDKFTDAEAIDAVIVNVVAEATKSVNNLKSCSDDVVYVGVLNNFIFETRKAITEEFNHIKRQIKLKNKPNNIDRAVSLSLCTEIACFTVRKQRFITSVKGPSNVADALLHLFSPSLEKLPNVSITVEDWTNANVYYLLSQLSKLLTSPFSIADIERKRCLFLKTGKLFIRSTYDNFRSQKLEAYTKANPDTKEIDDQLNALFS